MIRALPAGYNAGDMIFCYFASYDSNGASVTITGLATTDIEIFKDGSTTQRASDNGYTLLDTDGIDFDSSTGLQGFKVDTSDNSDAGFWADGSHYLIWVDAITVDGQTVRLGFEFRLGVVLRPTTAGRKLDVSSGGEGGLDWSNIGSPTTSQNLSGTTIKTATDVENDTQDMQSRLPAALVGGRIDANLSAAGLQSDAVAEIQSGLATQTTSDAIESAVDGLNDILTHASHGNAALNTDLDTLLSRMGTPSDLGNGATLAGNMVTIESQTDDIGTAGAGLTAIPWHSAWDAEVQSEVSDELEARGVTTTVTARIDAAISSRSTLTAQQVWEYATRTLTSFGSLVANIWDHLLTAITTAGSIGKRIKDNLDVAISSVSGGGGAGTGANAITVVVESPSGTPLNDAKVRFTGGPTPSFSITGAGADPDGTTVVGLDDGTYTLVVTFPGKQGHTATDLEITTTETLATIVLDDVSVTPPASVDYCTCYTITHDENDEPASGISMSFRIASTDSAGGRAFEREPLRTASSGVGGLLEIELVRGLYYQQRIGQGQWSEPFQVPDDDTFELPDALGRKIN